MTNDPNAPWKRLANAARTARLETDTPPVRPPRVDEFRRRVGTLLRRLLWRRSSLTLAGLATLAWLGTLLMSHCDPPREEPLIPIPADPTIQPDRHDSDAS